MGIVLGLALTVSAAVLLWFRPEAPSLEDQAFRKFAEGIRTSLTEAIRLFEEALKRDPLSPYRWCDLGGLGWRWRTRRFGPPPRFCE